VIECRCEVLNVMTGELAREYLRIHLDDQRTDGMGRTVRRCAETGVEWLEERRATGYGDEGLVLRRVQR
jgi:hypothetical protein